jgi:proline dehydrogenase
MMRSLFLYLSAAGWARGITMKLPVARKTARRFVAGEELSEAVAAAKVLNDKGMLVSLDLLGENVFSEADAQRAKQGYLELLDAIDKNKLNSSISIKLTQLGLDISEELATNNMRDLLRRAKAIGQEVTIDMESTQYTDVTLRVFRTLMKEFDNIGTVIQAYLYRSEADMHQLSADGATIRLCKGAYKEPPEHAYPEKADVDANYVKLMQLFMAEKNRQKGAYLQVATHDPKMVAATEKFVKENNIPNNQFEFQMLYGIRTALQDELAQKGYQVRIYVPYGNQWYPYFMRRLAERPANVWFFAKSLFSR